MILSVRKIRLVVYGAALERRFRGNSIEGSNPSSSANIQLMTTQDIQKLGTILGIWAHPDDETYSMAGILIAAAKNGQKIACVTATRGEAGVQDESRWPASSLADIRTKEQEAAFAVMGIPPCHMLDYPDGGCSEVDVQEAVERIADYILQYNPDSIFTFGPDGLTGHTDHQTVSEWATKAVKKAGSQAAIYHAVHTHEQYQHMLEADKHLNVYFNIDKPPLLDDCDCDICYVLPQDIFNIKLTALRAMPSQTEAMLTMFAHVLPKAVGIEAFKVYTTNR
jgi:LmbE family N-acetylglucosaminyl deacetylase